MSAAPQSSRSPRRVVRTVKGMPASDGAGVKLNRVIGQPALPDLDPFLMLDAFGSDDPAAYIAGFPSHPHRGFETVTYMLAGRMRHRDNKGNEGLLTAGSVQWMTAGRGIVHSEMPEQEEGRMAGFQLWVNLPAKDKMTAPKYRDIAPADVPSIELDGGVRVRVIAGETHGIVGAVTRPTTEPLVLDIALPAGSKLDVPLPGEHNAFAYVYEGAVDVGGQIATRVDTERMAILANDAGADGVRLVAAGGAARVLLVAGRPLREPIAQYGPFVMNTTEELQAAFADYQRGLLAT